MKLSNPKFAAGACLLVMLAAPAGVFARYRHPDPEHKKPVPVPEPSTLVMTVVGMSLGMGLIVAGLRRNRSTNPA
jgi:hypothetical protein